MNLTFKTEDFGAAKLVINKRPQGALGAHLRTQLHCTKLKFKLQIWAKDFKRNDLKLH